MVRLDRFTDRRAELMVVLVLALAGVELLRDHRSDLVDLVGEAVTRYGLLGPSYRL